MTGRKQTQGVIQNIESACVHAAHWASAVCYAQETTLMSRRACNQHDPSSDAQPPPGMPHSSSLTEELWLKSLLIFHAYGVENIPYPSLLQFYRLFAWGNKKYQTYQGFQTSDCEKRSCPLLAFTSCKTRVVLLSSSFTFLENFSLAEVGFEAFRSPPLCIFSVPF